ncbi:MinD/ParA family ATP-binding protein [Marinobacter confluentis]|uniref:MinD/ParA family protein n=1 Tax=Marinobacter confluentis TaxID=1697557 RepID=A0A4Z1CB17_9GAMM|nr:AAA family ATPase [Marinobacter confluentis]TGN41073.1 MinD/ParA family protein [Marinobacter confluentis]
MTDTTSAQQARRQPRTLAITGGKGGVGKTSVALNLALTLARDGSRVLLMDGDTDLANVSIMLGRYPQRTLADVLAGTSSLADTIMTVDYGLDILPGASGVDQCIDMEAGASLKVLKALSQLEKHYDFVITDTASGLQPTGMHMIAAAELACVVVTPDPASLTDAFSLIKLLVRRGYRRTPSILVNMAQGASQARTVFQRLEGAAQRHLGISLHYLGGIWRDETLRQSVLNQRPVALLPESDPSCRQFRSLSDMLNVRFRQISPKKAGVAAYWYRVSGKRQDHLPRASEPEIAPQTDAQLCQKLVGEISQLIAGSSDASLLRYEAFNEFFALLGRTMDDDAVEILQTGLASLPWENLGDQQRRQFATHLRHLASEVEPGSAEESIASTLPASPSSPVGRQSPEGESRQESRSDDSPPEPFYDRVSFGEQRRLIQALKEQPSDVALDQLLRTLARSGPDRR